MTGTETGLPALLGAMALAGLLGSGHCLAMCGGIAGALGLAAAAHPTWQRVLLFNGGRVLGYALLGLVAGLLSAGLGTLTGFIWLRLAAGLLLILLGLQLLTDRPLLAPLERLGARFWRRIAPRAGPGFVGGSRAGMLALGMLWALLPCGLVYTALAAALTSGGALPGAATTLAFGLGTLPAMGAATLGGGALVRGLRSRKGRRLAGGLILAGGLWALWIALPMGGDPHAPHTGHGAVPVQPAGH